MTQKEYATELLKILGVSNDYIKALKEKGWITMFDNYLGYWAFQYEDVMKKIREFELKNKAYVFALTHEITELGELYDFFFLPNNQNEYDDIISVIKRDEAVIYVYCWNKTDERMSEFGDITVKSAIGGLKRIA